LEKPGFGRLLFVHVVPIRDLSPARFERFVVSFVSSSISRGCPMSASSYPETVESPGRAASEPLFEDDGRAETERPAAPREVSVTPVLSPIHRDLPTNEFDYRPVPVAAPVALFLGISSVIGLFGVPGLPVGLVGLFVGWRAFRTIRRSSGELSGGWLAATGMALSAMFFVLGTALHSFAYATEVPEGFARVNFTRDISKKGFTVTDGEQSIHPEVAALDGKPVFLKGYMYPERKTEGLTSFVFVKDNQQCCFGGQPELTDMILVEMDPGMTVDYHTSLVSVAGVFRAMAPKKGDTLNTVYKLDASFFTPAKTSF